MTRWNVLVSDTGPLISLEKLPRGFEWVCSLLDQLLVPSAVRDEFAAPYGGRTQCLEKTGLRDLVVVRNPGPDALAHPEFDEDVLDEGEQQAIALAVELDCPYLLRSGLDERWRENSAARLRASRG